MAHVFPNFQAPQCGLQRSQRLQKAAVPDGYRLSDMARDCKEPANLRSPEDFICHLSMALMKNIGMGEKLVDKEAWPAQTQRRESRAKHQLRARCPTADVMWARRMLRRQEDEEHFPVCGLVPPDQNSLRGAPGCGAPTEGQQEEEESWTSVCCAEVMCT